MENKKGLLHDLDRAKDRLGDLVDLFTNVCEKYPDTDLIEVLKAVLEDISDLKDYVRLLMIANSGTIREESPVENKKSAEPPCSSKEN